MNAVEKLEAAIERLEEFQALDWPCPTWTQSAVRHIARNVDIDCADHDGDDEFEAGWDRYASGPAIYTLARTIDAQLDMLRFARGFYGAQITGPESSTLFAEFALSLADALLGDAS